MPMLPANPRRLMAVSVLAAILILPIARADTNDDAADRAYYSGNGFLNRGMYDLAADEYRKFLDAHPHHEKADVARYGLAVALVRRGKAQDAIAPLETLYAKSGFTYAAEVALMLGQCRMAAEQYAAAIKAFERIGDKHGDHPLAADALAQLVEAYYRNGKHKRAIAAGERMLKQHTDAAQVDRAAYFAGLAAMQTGEDTMAVRFLDHLLKTRSNSPFALHATLLLGQLCEKTGELDAAGTLYRHVISAGDGPYLPHAQLGIAHVLMRQSKPDEAALLLDALAKSKTAGALAATVQFDLGRLHFDAGRYEQAEKAFHAAVASSKTGSDEAAYWSAKCRLRRGDAHAAADALDAVNADVLADDERPLLLYDRAVAHLRRGDKENARKLFTSFREDYAKHALAADALYWLAALAHEQGQYVDSLKLASRFLEAHADNALAAKARFIIAETHFLQKQYDAAEKSYRAYLGCETDAASAGVARYRLGLSLYHLGKLAEARPLLEQAAEKDDSSEAFSQRHLVLGDIRFQANEWAAAADHLRKYIDGGSDRPAIDDALLKLGIAEHRLGKYDEAIAAYRKLLSDFAESSHRSHAMFEQGQSLVALERFDEAKKLFEAVAGESGAERFTAAVQRHLAAIALKLGDSKEAARRFKALAKAADSDEAKTAAIYEEGRALYAAGDYEAAEKTLARFLERDEKHEHANDARATRGMALARLKRHADALDLMKHVKFDELSAAERSALLYEKAWCLRSLEKADAAADVYRNMLKADETGTLLPNVLLELAELESAAGHIDKAIPLLKRIVSMAGDDPQTVTQEIGIQAQYRLGTSLFQQKQFDEAASVLAAFIKANTENQLADSAAFFCGESLFELGRKTEAIAHFERAAKKLKDDARGPSLLRLGECYAAGQYWPKSEETFTAYLAAYPDADAWFQAQFGIGWARENQGRYNDAITAYRGVVDRHKGPTAARAQFQIGQCLFAAKQYDEAARELVKVDILYAYPEWSAAALYEAGRCFEKLAKLIEARRQYAAVVENYKDTRWAQLAKQQLAAIPQSDLPGRD